MPSSTSRRRWWRRFHHGIREVDVDGRQRALREEARREEPGVALQDHEVREAAALRLLAQLVGELAPLLDRHERPVRVGAPEGHGEAPVTGANLELQAGGARAEPRGPVGEQVERDGRFVGAREDHRGAPL